MYTTTTVLSNRTNAALRPEFSTSIRRFGANSDVKQEFITLQVAMMDATGPEDYANDHDGNVSFYFSSRDHLAQFVASLVDAYDTFDTNTTEALRSMASLEYDADDKETYDAYVRTYGRRAVDYVPPVVEVADVELETEEWENDV